MSKYEIVTGDDIALSLTLEENGVATSISDSASVKAMLKYQDESISPTVTLNKDTTGANWGSGVVVVVFTSAESALISKVNLNADLEIEVDDSGKQTWHHVVRVVKGLI